MGKSRHILTNGRNGQVTKIGEGKYVIYKKDNKPNLLKRLLDKFSDVNVLKFYKFHTPSCIFYCFSINGKEEIMYNVIGKSFESISQSILFYQYGIEVNLKEIDFELDAKRKKI